MSRGNIVPGARRARSKAKRELTSARRAGPRRGGPRRGGQGTREQLLETAGQVFSEKGYDGTTSKEICERCGANVAAVVYHFGGLDNLYTAALQEARSRLAPSEALAAAVAAESAAKGKLTAFMRLLVQVVSGPATSTWAVRLISRELISPTPIFDAIRNKEMQARGAILRSIVAALTGLPEDHTSVALSCVNIMAPFGIVMLISPQRIERVFPALSFRPETVEQTTQHLVRFAMGGLAAIAAAYQNDT